MARLVQRQEPERCLVDSLPACENAMVLQDSCFPVAYFPRISKWLHPSSLGQNKQSNVPKASAIRLPSSDASTTPPNCLYTPWLL